MISVIVPAYNEEAGLGRMLEGLVRSPDFGPDLDVIVAANGCVDGTAEVARSYGVQVLDLPTPSKTGALNAAEAIAQGYPRIYLDADIAVTPNLLRALADAVSQPGILGATAGRVVDTSGSSWPVRAFYAINTRLPALQGRLFGRGVIALAQPARERFGQFPEIIADDMLLDAVVAASEKAEIPSPVRVTAPATVAELVRRLSRSRAGNDEFWAWAATTRDVRLADPVPGASATSWLRDVVAPSPRLWPAGVCYVAIQLLVALRLRRPGYSARSGWGR